MAWSDRHGAWVITRFPVKSDGATACKRVDQRSAARCCRGLVQRAHSALEPTWPSRMWLGKTEKSDEYLIAMETMVVTARNGARRPDEERAPNIRAERTRRCCRPLRTVRSWTRCAQSERIGQVGPELPWGARQTQRS